jgi:hypothetical protein
MLGLESNFVAVVCVFTYDAFGGRRNVTMQLRFIISCPQSLQYSHVSIKTRRKVCFTEKIPAWLLYHPNCARRKQVDALSPTAPSAYRALPRLSEEIRRARCDPCHFPVCLEATQVVFAHCPLYRQRRCFPGHQRCNRTSITREALIWPSVPICSRPS